MRQWSPKRMPRITPLHVKLGSQLVTRATVRVQGAQPHQPGQSHAPCCRVPLPLAMSSAPLLEHKLLPADRLHTLTCSFGENSTFTLPQAGEYKGPDAIAEYVRFASEFSPLFDEAITLNDRVELLSSDSGICTFRRFSTVRAVASDVLYPGGVLHFTAMYRINFDYEANQIPSMTLYFTPQAIAHIFETWAGSANSSSHGLVCSTMEESCPSTWFSNSLSSKQDCLDALETLPVLQDGTYFDGNSQSCRVLHAVFARTNDMHCPHISFVPAADSAGGIKCQESAGMLPGDTFTEDDLQTFRDWMVEEGIPEIGYVVDPAEPIIKGRIHRILKFFAALVLLSRICG